MILKPLMITTTAPTQDPALHFWACPTKQIPFKSTLVLLLDLFLVHFGVLPPSLLRYLNSSSWGGITLQECGLWPLPTFLPNYCCCCWVELFVKKKGLTWSVTWIQATSQQMSPTPRRWAFLKAFGEKRLRLEQIALRHSQKAEKRKSGWAVWMDWSNCSARRSPGETGRQMKEAQMSLLNISSFDCF